MDCKQDKCQVILLEKIENQTNEDIELSTFDTHSCEKEQTDYNEFVENVGCGCYQFFIGIFDAFGWIIVASNLCLMLVLPQVVKFEYKLTIFQTSLIVFLNRISLGLGSMILGAVSDRFGRMLCFRICSFLLTVSYCVCSICQNFYLIIFVCSIIGFISGIFASVDGFYVDFLPIKCRATALCIGHFMFAIGFMAEHAKSFLCLSIWKYDRRIWLNVAAVTPGIVFLLSLVTPENPRYQLRMGLNAAAYKTINRAAKINRKQIPGPEFLKTETNVKKHTFKSFRKLEYSSIVFFIISIAVGIVYIGTILNVSTSNDNQEYSLYPNSSLHNNHSSMNLSESVYFSRDKIYEIMTANSGELIVPLLSILLTNCLGRKGTFIFIYFTSPCVRLVFIFIKHKTVHLMSVFALRTLMSTLATNYYIYSSEFFPSSIRTFGMGVSFFLFSFGSAITSFIVGYLQAISTSNVHICFLAIEIFCLILSFTLKETKNSRLK